MSSDLLLSMRTIVGFILLIHLTTSKSNSPSNVVAECNQTWNHAPSDFIREHTFNPSPLHSLSLKVNECENSLSINWSVNIDGSIQSLERTWIKVLDPLDLKYICKYQPPFTSEQNNLTGIQQLHFSLTVENVSVDPETEYNVLGYNLPPPPSESPGDYMKRSVYETQGCEIRKKPLCDPWDANVSSILYDEKIAVKFFTTSMTDRYLVELRDETDILNSTLIKEVGKEEKLKVELTYSGTCKDFMIWIIPFIENCEDLHCCTVKHEVKCTNSSGLAVAVAVGCVLVFLLVVFVCYFMRRMFVWGHSSGSELTTCVQVLVVYPAVDGVFQHKVMLLAESLQSCGDIRVVIDTWDRGSLSEQGLIRWLHTEAELADKILFVLPPQHPLTEDIKVNPHHTVSASASSLFALALNLVTSSAHDPHKLDKFWVIDLEQNEEKRKVPVELRGCGMFVLPRDQQKLHQKISNRTNLQRSLRIRCFNNFP
ncbi:interleukin-17 receptor B [Misgurnus anguillicaudatus]|uniref:interleukin-17 receptor B n=1 Tax=Misgurnus anguillicaudatus TaxID=75329 RepID=UPI003CCF6F1E